MNSKRTKKNKKKAEIS